MEEIMRIPNIEKEWKSDEIMQKMCSLV